MSATAAAPVVAVRYERHAPDRTRLTRTQRDVLARLEAKRHLWPHGRGAGAVEPGPSTAGPRTLKALADAGHAHLVVSRPGSGVLPYYAAGNGRVHTYSVRDADGTRLDEASIPAARWERRAEADIEFAQELAADRAEREGRAYSVLVVQ